MDPCLVPTDVRLSFSSELFILTPSRRPESPSLLSTTHTLTGSSCLPCMHKQGRSLLALNHHCHFSFPGGTEIHNIQSEDLFTYFTCGDTKRFEFSVYTSSLPSCLTSLLSTLLNSLILLSLYEHQATSDWLPVASPLSSRRGKLEGIFFSVLNVVYLYQTLELRYRQIPAG